MTIEGDYRVIPVYGPASYSAHLQALSNAGFMVTFHENREKPYGVFLGSHGGTGVTPQQAVKACLRCCNIGHWWMLNGRPVKTVVREIYRQFDGAWQ